VVGVLLSLLEVARPRLEIYPRTFVAMALSMLIYVKCGKREAQRMSSAEAMTRA